MTTLDTGYLSADPEFALKLATGKIDIESLKNNEAFKSQEDEALDQISRRQSNWSNINVIFISAFYSAFLMR